MRDKLLLLLLPPLVAVATGWSPEAAAEEAAEAGLNGRIAFVSSDGVSFLDLSDCIVHPLTEDGRVTHSPALSPDGRRLAWVAEDGGCPDIHLLELNVDGEGREAVRLTDTRAAETDLSWSVDGELLYFSAYEAIDYGGFGIHADTREELEHLAGTTYGYAAYYYSFKYANVEPQVVFPGDYRHPLHVPGLGLVCSYEPWSPEVSHFEPGLVLIHDALACDQLTTLDAEAVARFPGGELLLRLRGEDGTRSYARCHSQRFELLEEWPGDGWRNLVPLNVEGWFVGETAAAPNSRPALVLDPGGPDEHYIYLTPSDYNASEPSWSSLEVE